ncbi:MAG: hypothetical protein IJJ94_10060 [Bacteroidaceae bacterium]|jgi:hypothetical protein|nr:hypothetical protein [Bacteroidaceae bacterium]
MAIKNSDNAFVKCIECKHATFMQWFENPVIAICDVTKQRQVAQAKRLCQSYAESGVEPDIQHFDSYN